VNPDSFPRRAFLRGGSSALLAAMAAPVLRAVEPFPHTEPARLRLSLAAYSLRDEFAAGRGGTPPALDMFGFVDYCAANGCDGAELTSYYFPPTADDAYFIRLRRHAFLRGVSVSGTAVANNFTHPRGPERDQQVAHVKRWIANAAVLGAPHIRVFAGDPKGRPAGEAIRNTIESLEECGETAAKHGIFLGLENHGGIVAESAPLLEIVRTVRNPWVGINLDTGNFHTDDPHADLAKCAPYAVNVQYKGYLRARADKAQRDDEIRVTFDILRRAKYQGWVALEYELADPPRSRIPSLLREMRTEIGRS
jgi:sugar phosphate isomerase/epimerase